MTKNSPLLSNESVPLDKYYTQPGGRRGGTNKTVPELIKELTKEGYWLTPLRSTSNPYKECPGMGASNETKYTTTFVGDEYDTSMYDAEEPVMGISMAVYISNMMKLIGYLDN